MQKKPRKFEMLQSQKILVTLYGGLAPIRIVINTFMWPNLTLIHISMPSNNVTNNIAVLRVYKNVNITYSLYIYGAHME